MRCWVEEWWQGVEEWGVTCGNIAPSYSVEHRHQDSVVLCRRVVAKCTRVGVTCGNIAASYSVEHRHKDSAVLGRRVVVGCRRVG